MATGVRVGTLVGAERVMDLKVEVVEGAEGGVVVLGAAVDTTTALIVVCPAP
jgi:aromatic ring hydroxylase